MPERILIIEDDPLIAGRLTERLGRSHGRGVQAFGSLGEAEGELPSAGLVVLDLGLPDAEGMEAVGRVRTLAPSALLLVATARGALRDRVDGLRSGADDYLVKPFSLLELEARVEALLRRRKGRSGVAHGHTELGWDPAGRKVQRGAEILPLTPLEYAVFSALAGRPGQALSRAQLLREVIGPNFYGYERVVDVHVAHLRRKLDAEDPYRYIGTVRHYGYRWDGPRLTEEIDAAQD